MATNLTPALLEGVAERFRVLGDPTRLAILNTLLQRGEMNVGELVEAIGSSQANVSKHLRVLHESHFVSRRQHGTSAYYAVSDPSITQLCDIVCDRIREQADAEVAALRG